MHYEFVCRRIIVFYIIIVCTFVHLAPQKFKLIKNLKLPFVTI
uniref:Uncharacterized protein n=1 Tax=Arundo donax TaxID=35708 RepID=A0A0A9ALH7_ARUDO